MNNTEKENLYKVLDRLKKKVSNNEIESVLIGYLEHDGQAFITSGGDGSLIDLSEAISMIVEYRVNEESCNE